MLQEREELRVREGERGGGGRGRGRGGGKRGRQFDGREDPAFRLRGAGAVEVGDEEGGGLRLYVRVRVCGGVGVWSRGGGGGGRLVFGVVGRRRRRGRVGGDGREEPRVRRLEVELDASDEGEGGGEEGEEAREEGEAGEGVGVDVDFGGSWGGWGRHGGLGLSGWGRV